MALQAYGPDPHAHLLQIVVPSFEVDRLAPKVWKLEHKRLEPWRHADGPHRAVVSLASLLKVPERVLTLGNRD
jgi:hypothetical protein